jgi:hypothetical protein
MPARRTATPPIAKDASEPVLILTVTATTTKEWELRIPTAVIRQAIEEIKTETGCSSYSPVYAVAVLEKIRQQGGALAESIPDPEPWQEYNVEPFKLYTSLLLQVEEAWHENNDD